MEIKRKIFDRKKMTLFLLLVLSFLLPVAVAAAENPTIDTLNLGSHPGNVANIGPGPEKPQTLDMKLGATSIVGRTQGLQITLDRKQEIPIILDPTREIPLLRLPKIQGLMQGRLLIEG